MAVRRWTTLWVVALTLVTGLLATAPARAQYYNGELPAGVKSVTVDGKPINAGASPETEKTSPVIAGTLDPGPTEAELAIADGDIVTFTVQVKANGSFQGTPPKPLKPGKYTLYIDDALIGDFTVTKAAAPAFPLDMGLLVPLPADFGDGFGLVDGKYVNLQEEAQRTAGNQGDASSAGVKKSEDALQATGWQRRYENRVAQPKSDDPTQFQLLVGSFAIEFASAEQAQTAYKAVASQGGEVVEGAPTIGDGSTFVSGSGTTTDTSADYQLLGVTFTVDRVLVNIAVSNLANEAPDQDQLAKAARAVQGRIEDEIGRGAASATTTRFGFQNDPTATAEAGAEATAAPGDATDADSTATADDTASATSADNPAGLSARVLRLQVGDGLTFDVHDEAYDRFDGALVPRYAETADQAKVREDRIAGADASYNATFEGSLGGANDQGTAAAGDARFRHVVALYEFKDDATAKTWLDGVKDRISNDPLRGYLSMSPVDGSKQFGDGSVAYAFRYRSAAATTSGFRYYVQVGSTVAQVEVATAAGASQEVVEQVVQAQADCLTAGACEDPIAAPDGLS